VEGGGITLSLGVSRKGIKFGAPGKKLTHIIFFLLIPTAASVFYLRLLAGISESFMKIEARKKLVAAKQPEELWKTLVKLTRSSIK